MSKGKLHHHHNGLVLFARESLSHVNSKQEKTHGFNTGNPPRQSFPGNTMSASALWGQKGSYPERWTQHGEKAAQRGQACQMGGSQGRIPRNGRGATEGRREALCAATPRGREWGRSSQRSHVRVQNPVKEAVQQDVYFTASRVSASMTFCLCR